MLKKQPIQDKMLFEHNPMFYEKDANIKLWTWTMDTHSHRPQLLLLLIVVMLSSACTSTMGIYSRPAGADVVMDRDKTLGKTPILLKEQTWIWTRHQFTFTKAGYESQTIKVSAKARPANMVLAVCTTSCCLWPVALLGQLPDTIVATMTPDANPYEQASLTESVEISFE